MEKYEGVGDSGGNIQVGQPSKLKMNKVGKLLYPRFYHGGRKGLEPFNTVFFYTK